LQHRPDIALTQPAAIIGHLKHPLELRSDQEIDDYFN
jgi:hypothetical protein